MARSRHIGRVKGGMVFHEAGQTLDKTLGAAMRMGDANVFEVLGDGIGHLTQGGDLSIPKVGTRLIVNDAKGTENMTSGTVQRDLGVEAEIGPSGDIGTIFEEVLLGKVSDDVTGGIGGHVDGVDDLGGILAGEQGNGMRTDPPDQVEGADPQVDAIIGVMLILIAQGDGFGGFGDQILIGAIDDGDEGAVAGKAKDSQLSQRRESDIGRQPDVGSGGGGGGIPMGGRVSRLLCGRFQTEGGTIDGAIVPSATTVKLCNNIAVELEKRVVMIDIAERIRSDQIRADL